MFRSYSYTMPSRNLSKVLQAMLLASALTAPVVAQEADIQQQLANPISSLTLVPIQVNYDRGIGPIRDGYRFTTNIQPVIPFKLNDNWSLVTRTIFTVIGQREIFPGAGSQFGLGDTLQSFFFVPQTRNGFTWGVGPAIAWRTGTDSLTTSGKWSAGPTAVVLQQQGAWTFGLLANHIWSFAGDAGRANVSSTYLQPFVAYGASGGWTYTLNTESSYNWTTKDWSVPINATVSKLSKLGNMPVSYVAGARYWAETPDKQGPEGWGVRVGMTFILK